MKKAISGLEVVATLSMIVACLVFVWTSIHGQVGQPVLLHDEPQQGQKPLVANIEDKHLDVATDNLAVSVRGHTSLVLVEFSDFQCPFCGKYATTTYGQIKQHFVDTGQLGYVFINFPLENIHPSALKAAAAGECARQQNKFWEMHDLLFLDQKSLDPNGLLTRAHKLDLDETAFAACIDSQVPEKIRSDEAIGQRVGVTATPTFFLGSMQANGTVRLQREIHGAVPYDVFKDTIESALVAHQTKG